jgi:hypothetical protein
MRQVVRIAVAAIIPQEQIALLIKHPKTGLPIGETSLKKYFDAELKTGSAEIKFTHAMSLMKAHPRGQCHRHDLVGQNAQQDRRRL